MNMTFIYNWEANKGETYGISYKVVSYVPFIPDGSAKLHEGSLNVFIYLMLLLPWNGFHGNLKKMLLYIPK